MGITTIEEHLDSSDIDPTGYADMISKGFGVCTTGVQRRTVLGQGFFSVPHNVRQRCPRQTLRSTFLPRACGELCCIESSDAYGLMLASSYDLDTGGECAER